MPRHAYLSASASHRWLSCPPSAKLCAEINDEASPYAQQGTDAHELCEYKVLHALGQDIKDPTENLDFFDTEMDDCTDEYCSYNVTDFESLEDALLRMIVSCPHEGNSISMERFLHDLTPSGRKKTVFYFTTDYNNDAMLQAADVCLARAAVIGPHGYDTRDEGLSVDLLPEDTRTVKSLHLNMEK